MPRLNPAARLGEKGEPPKKEERKSEEEVVIFAREDETPEEFWERVEALGKSLAESVISEETSAGEDLPGGKYSLSPEAEAKYVEWREKSEDRVSRVEAALEEIETSVSGEDIVNSYMELLEREVYPEFENRMIFLILYSDHDESNSGGHVQYMNDLLLPTLRSLETKMVGESQDIKAKALVRLLDFTKRKFNTDHRVFNTHRYEFAKSLINIGGLRALPHVQEMFDDLFEKIKEDEDRFTRIMQNELGISPDKDIVWAFDRETGALGYFPRDRISDIVVPVGPQNDEEFFTPEALEFGSHDHLMLHRDLVTFLGEQGRGSDQKRTEVLEFLGEFMKYNSHGVLEEYVRVIEDLGVNHAIPYLLANLKGEDVLKRRMSAEILFRLELGRVEVGKNGVGYLGKLYDLREYNDPDFFVRRLNNSGLMGVLSDEEDQIKGVFSLDLEAQERVVRAEVRYLLSEELFLPKADETDFELEQREKYLQLFLDNYEGIFNDEFFQGTGVRLNSLDLHEQGWFLLTYMELSEEVGDNPQKLERLRAFVRKFGEYGLKTFLALEYGGSGEDILEFAASHDLTDEEKRAVFKNFYAIANEAFNWRGIFNQVEDNVGWEFAPQVHEAFVRKNAEFFKAAQMIARGEAEDVTIGELLEKMNTIAFSMRILKGLHKADASLELEQNPQHQGEYNSEGNWVEKATSTYILRDKKSGARVVVSVRPIPTVKRGNRAGGEARINFKVTNPESGDQTRIAFDLSDYGEYAGAEEKPPVVSLDLGVGKPDREEGIWPSQRVGRVLGLVEGSEGGHNELSFKPETAGHFPKVAEQFRNYMETKFVEEV